MLEFLSQRLVKQVHHSFMKVFIVGSSKSGKSSLSRGIESDSTREPESFGTGLEVRTLKMAHINISLWEFDGQDEFCSTQTFFMAERAIFIVVYNTNDEKEQQLENVKSWFQKIKARAPKAPVIVIGTHRDQVADEDAERLRTTWEDHIEIIR